VRGAAGAAQLPRDLREARHGQDGHPVYASRFRCRATPVLTEDRLCHAWSCQETEDQNVPGGWQRRRRWVVSVCCRCLPPALPRGGWPSPDVAPLDAPRHQGRADLETGRAHLPASSVLDPKSPASPSACCVSFLLCCVLGVAVPWGCPHLLMPLDGYGCGWRSWDRKNAEPPGNLSQISL
jgi:hypothetical protein